MSDWDMETISYNTNIRYYCPEEGWGFPLNGKSEIQIKCQADKTWTLTEVPECICKLQAV